jgi:membrane protease YdiL (CAAX protease family)
MRMVDSKQNHKAIVRKQTLLFLALTMGVSFLLDGITWAVAGTLQEAPEIWGLVLRVRMLIPALSAILLLTVMQRDRVTRQAAIVFIGFGIVVGLPLILRITGLPEKWEYGSAIISLVGQVLTCALTVTVVIMHFKKRWRSNLSVLHLGLEKNIGLFLIVLFSYTLLLGISFALNPIFGMSTISQDTSIGRLVLTFLRMLAVIPLFGWIPYFGEEYGWRAYLQERLCRLWGVRWGVLAVGIIWGLWHAPVIAMGYNYPGRPVLGIVAMVLFTTVIGVIYSYVVIKTGSIWPAVMLHGITNTMGPRCMHYFGQAHDSVFSFGLGVYGIALFAVPALFLFIRHMGRNHGTSG